MLERARAEMGTNDGAANKTGMTRVESALKATDLKKDAGFQKLDAATQKNVLDEIGRQQEQPAAVDNLVALAKSPGFQAASPATQGALQSTLSQHARDPIFREGLAKLAGDAAFQKLTPAQQADALGAFDKVAKSEVYQGKEGSWFFGVGGKHVGDADKRTILDNARQVVTSTGFHDVGAGASRQAMMNALGQHATDAAFTGRLVKLSNDQGFLALNDATKETRLLERYGADKSFAQGVDTLLGNAKYTCAVRCGQGEGARRRGEAFGDELLQGRQRDRQAGADRDRRRRLGIQRRPIRPTRRCATRSTRSWTATSS